jgi:hypothetical protein
MGLNTTYFAVSFQQYGQDINADIKNVNTSTVATSKWSRPGIQVKEWDTNFYQPPIDETLIEHLNLLYKLIGSDMTYEKYCNMSQQDIKNLNRDLKINLIQLNSSKIDEAFYSGKIRLNGVKFSKKSVNVIILKFTYFH